MHDHLESSGPDLGGAWLYLAELVHRVSNEYTAAISTLRVAASRTPNPEVQSAISETVRRLGAFAAAHTLLRPPSSTGRVDLADHLGKLCSAIALARFEDQPVVLSIRTTRPIMLDVARCWRVGLIVSELITNAARHAFGTDGQRGEIVVGIDVAGGDVICAVSDTGAWTTKGKPGLGSAVTASLAIDLGGALFRRPTDVGTSVVLTFPEWLPEETGPAAFGRGDYRGLVLSPGSRAPVPAFIA